MHVHIPSKFNSNTDKHTPVYNSHVKSTLEALLGFKNNKKTRKETSNLTKTGHSSINALQSIVRVIFVRLKSIYTKRTRVQCNGIPRGVRVGRPC